MSAAEIIEQIKALPFEEQRLVLAFFNESKPTAREPSIKFATDAQAKKAGDAVVAQFPEVFKRLAE